MNRSRLLKDRIFSLNLYFCAKFFLRVKKLVIKPHGFGEILLWCYQLSFRFTPSHPPKENPFFQEYKCRYIELFEQVVGLDLRVG